MPGGSMFDFFSLMVAIVALIVARKTFNEIAALKARLYTLERSSAPASAAATPPPLAPRQEPDRTFSSSPPEVPAEPAIVAATAPIADAPLTSPAADTGGAAPPAPPPLPQPVATPSCEERIGTRWVVWVGGLTLALGGFFMVRYSIEAGLIGPGVRVMLGGAFALALLAAGEWTRRKENLSSIASLPIANIPAILTAAGTSVAFATVYAAYALYGFLA